MRKKLFTFLLALVTSVGLMWAQGPWTSGDCTVTLSGGVITVSGNGAMGDNTGTPAWGNASSTTTSIVIGDGVTYVGAKSFGSYYYTTTLTLGNSVERIGNYAFSMCIELTAVEFPSTLQTIGASAFNYCQGLTSLSFPAGLLGINDYAFSNCTGLTSVTCAATTPPTLGENVFNNVTTANIPLYVPAGSVEAYTAAAQWNAFNIQGYGSAVDPAVQNVIDLIDAIPNPVVYNSECYAALDAVYEAYRVLSSEQKEQVTNYDDYLAAEERYYMLADVNYVIEKINEIGNVEFTSACKHRIDYARSEYCSLTLEAKGYVTNYNTLLAAEAAYAALIPVISTVVWDEAILATIDADEWGEETYTNGSLSLKAVDGRAHYVDGEEHFLFDGSNSEKSFVFSCTSANMLCIEITVSEKHEHNELSCAWQETATGYRWVGEATSVDLASTIFKVTGIRFSLGEAFPEPTPTPAQDGDKLPGTFSVSGEKVVYFSKGNLQYLGNIDRWHFAENQWTIIGNSQASDNRDLFSWGTGDNPDSDDYSTFTEWGNNIEGNWRTLTVEEWTYLFNTRTGASSKYGTATVAGVVGLILLPDVYDGTAINTERTAWDNNVISSSEWAAYEAKGAVFLPAAGVSDAYGVYGVGEQGFYWSSTMDAFYYANAVFYGFDAFEGYWFNDVDAQFQPQEGHSVRLVSETAPTPTPSDEQVPTNEDPENPGVYYYSTFFHSTQNYKLTNDGTQAFIADLSGSDLVLTKIAEGAQVIPANTAVILRKTGSADPIVLNPTEENGVSFNSDDNSLEGVDVATPIDDIAGLTTTNCYVLSGTAQYGVGFYRINGNTLKAHKAYVKYVGGPNNAPKRMRFVYDQATGMDQVQGNQVQSTKFIENGQLFILRDGKTYNAMGQIVK